MATMRLKVSLAINVETPAGGWIMNLIDLTPAIKAFFAARAAIERGADRLGAAVDSALGLNKMCWGMG